MGSYHYHYHTDLNLIELRHTGVVENSDVVSYLEEILSLGIATEGTIEYVDLSEIAGLKADYDAASGFTGLFGELLSRGWQGAVFFAPREYQFGMVRMLGAVLESMQERPAAALIPRREPTALGDVRGLITEHLHLL